MFLAMNRFRITSGREDAFVEHRRSRNGHLDEVPSFVAFHLLRGASNEEHTLFASQSIWASKQCFHNWTRNEGFRKGQAAAGRSSHAP